MKKLLFKLMAILILINGASARETKRVTIERQGYQEKWIRLQNPDPELNKSEPPVLIVLPLCSSKIIKKLDQFCATPEGTLGIVTGIRPDRLAYEPIEPNSTQYYAQLSMSRKPAGVLVSDIDCEASCPQLGSSSPCHANGKTVVEAKAALEKLVELKKDSECKFCDTQTIVCDNKSPSTF